MEGPGAAGHAHPHLLDAHRRRRPDRHPRAPAPRSPSCSTTTRLKRAAALGANVAAQLGRTFDEAEYVGPPGLCPLCHLDAIVLTGRDVQCATCGATGHLDDDVTVSWTDLDSSVISMAEKRAHYDEILETAQRHAARARHRSSRRQSTYDSFDPVVRPGRTPDEQEARQ